MSKNFPRNIVIMFGGQSSEHEATRKSFAYLVERINLKGLKRNLKVTHVMYVTRDGYAFISDFDSTKKIESYEDITQKKKLADALSFIKEQHLFIYGILYGQNGEDGRLQGAIDYLSLESNLGGILSCSLGMSKYHLNKYIKNNFKPIKIPETVCIKNIINLDKTLVAFEGKELVVKPNSLGSSILTEKFLYNKQTFPRVKKLIKQILELDSRALVQEYVRGAEYSCGCLEKDGKTIVLPAVRIETAHNFFGQKEKFIPGYSTETIVENKDESESLKLAKNVSKTIFEDLDFRNAVRFDYIINAAGVYFLETNPLPGILKGSILPRMMRTMGLDVEDLVEISWNNERLRRKLKTDFNFKVEV